MRDTKGTEETDDSTELAKDRTDWAEDRTLLANERTFAGWMRTGMACVALALGLRAVFDAAEPKWIAKAVATVFILTAIGIFWASALKSKEAQKRIGEHDTEAQDHANMVRIAAALTVGALGTGAILWAL
ncbi:MAG: YidH family protein [Hasllibacter sp.]